MARRATVKMSVEELLAQLKKHQSRLPKLQRKERKLQKQLAAVQAEIAVLGGAVASLPVAKRGRKAKVVKAAKAAGRKPVKRAKNKVKLAEAILAVLSKDKSLSVPEIATAVKANGYTSKSKTFETIIYQTLGRDKRVKRASRGQYQLKG